MALAATGYPLVLTSAYVEINGYDLSCFCEEISLEPTNNEDTLTTFCGVYRYTGSTEWHFIAKLLTSFNAKSVDDTLTNALTTWQTTHVPCPFVVRHDAGTPVSAGNPNFNGTMVPQPFKRLGGAAGAAVEIDIDWSILDGPNRDDTGTLAEAAGTAKKNNHAGAASA